MGSSSSPAAVTNFHHSGAPELNHSPRVREGDRETISRGQCGTSVMTLSREVTQGSPALKLQTLLVAVGKTSNLHLSL